MKRFYHILFSLSMLVLAVACTDEAYDISHQANGGHDAVLSLSCDMAADEELIVTRAGDVDQDPRKVVKDLYVFVVQEDQTANDCAIIYKYYFDSKDAVSGVSTSNQAYSSDGYATCNWSTLKLDLIRSKTGNTYLIAIANIAYKNNTALLSDLNKCTTSGELKKIMVSEGQVLDANLLYLSGYYLAPQLASSADAWTSEKLETINVAKGENKLSGKIYLKPTMSTISFSISSKGNCFIPRYWKVHNAPLNTSLLQSTEGNWQDGSQIFDSEVDLDFDTKSIDYDNPYATTGTDVEYSFKFVMQERKGNTLQTSESFTGYDMRVAKKDNSDELKNGPTNATMVEITGIYNQKNPDNTITSSDMTIMVPLGDWRSNMADYDIFRNKRYSYSVKIKGMNNVTVSSRDDIGGVFFTTPKTQIFEVDAHYASVVVGFKKKDFNQYFNPGTEPAAQVLYHYSTPFGNNTANLSKWSDANTTPADANTDWVTFAYMGSSATTVGAPTYPLTYTSTYADNSEGIAFDKNATGDANEKLLSMDGFMADLKAKVADASNADDVVFYYTIFVDEYYYDTKPGTAESVDWVKFVNQPERVLHLFARPSDYNGGAYNSAIEIRQRSIQTIYNTAKTSLKAWGLECIEEDVSYEVNNPNAKTSKISTTTNFINGGGVFEVKDFNQQYSNAREHHCLALRNQNWDNYLNIIDGKYTDGLIKGTDVDLLAASLTRNRDLNRNGKIDDNEIRWYIPELHVYQMMMIGDYGILDPTARLYFDEIVTEKANPGTAWSLKHYLSSDKKGDFNVFWAEEGTSTCRHIEGDGGDNWYVKKFIQNKYQHIRLIRNLGTNISDAKDTYVHILQSTCQPAADGSGTEYTIDLSNMNSASVRNAMALTEPLGSNTTFSLANRPASKFKFVWPVNGKDGLENARHDSFSAHYNDFRNGLEYKTQWRVPNLSELTLMSLVKIGRDESKNIVMNESGKILCRTQYEYSPNNPTIVNGNKYGCDGPRYYHFWSGSNMMLMSSDNIDTTNGGTKLIYVQDVLENEVHGK